MGYLSFDSTKKLHNQNFGASSSGCTDQHTKIGVKLKSCWSFDRQLWIRHRAHFNYHHVVPDKYYPAAAIRPESHFQSPCFTSPTQLSVPSELEERLFRAPVFQSLLKRFYLSLFGPLGMTIGRAFLKRSNEQQQSGIISYNWSLTYNQPD